MENYKEIILNCSNNLNKVVHEMIATREKEVSQNLPLLPLDLIPLSERLGKIDFTLVVSGEVNRGKSTFINAIIGSEILPTFDKETTSQVFKIKNSEKESYTVVYGNGDRKTIGREDLIKYGTQLDAYPTNVNGIEEGQILFIEVCYPIKNLPAGVTIVDTPGIGSTFKEHTEIAKGFMQEADAIIYLCSSKHPMVKVDIDFITKSILPLPTSPNMLFVMSKADQADSEDALQKLVARAQEQLMSNFKDYSSIGKVVIPVDSLSLMEANNASSVEEKDALRSVSNFDEVNNAIVRLIERQKFCWLIATFNSAAKYYKLVNAYLDKQIKEYDLNEENREAKLASLNSRLERVEDELGLSRQRVVLTEVSNILSSLRAEIKKEFTSDKSILLKKFNNKIDELPKGLSSEALNEEAQRLFKDVVEDAVSNWEELCETAVRQIQSSLNIYHKECQVQIDEEYNLETNSDNDFSVDLNVTMTERIDAMRGKYFSALFGTTVGVFAINALAATSATVASIVSSSAFLGPAGWIIGGGTILYGLFYGNKKAKEKAFAKAKSEIKGHVSEILEEIYNQLTQTSLMEGKHESMLHSFEKSMEDGVTDSISEIYSRTKKELEGAKRALVDSANTSNRVKVVNQQTLWNNFAITLQKIVPNLKGLKAEFEGI
ncbi:dynamin family protein [Bacteroides acidifaciens]|uniref:dynamin family protein n=1 Tax=Bacteroides acidifaciens TaxID=85831 RepID=UPI002584A75C|nr:dynamin family protein [Bacteroides acidifaciens]